jgi:hypothetical protein
MTIADVIPLISFSVTVRKDLPISSVSVVSVVEANLAA